MTGWARVGVVVAALLAALVGAAGAEGTEDVLGFRTFCDGWMGKLREREAHNTANIKWDRREGRVVGEHVAYGTDCTCVARQEPGRDPIGKITYREFLYRRSGPTPSEALEGPATLVEQSEVTEIFRHAQGRWQY